MKISRRSPLTGKVNTMEIPVTDEQLRRWKEDRELIQNVMPELTADQREFLISGYTPEDWATLFPKGDDNE